VLNTEWVCKTAFPRGFKPPPSSAKRFAERLSVSRQHFAAPSISRGSQRSVKRGFVRPRRSDNSRRRFPLQHRAVVSRGAERPACMNIRARFARLNAPLSSAFAFERRSRCDIIFFWLAISCSLHEYARPTAPRETSHGSERPAKSSCMAFPSMGYD